MPEAVWLLNGESSQLQKRKSLAIEMPLKAVVRGHRAAVVMSMLLTCTLSARSSL
jgi:hypothetical protein